MKGQDRGHSTCETYQAVGAGRSLARTLAGALTGMAALVVSADVYAGMRCGTKLVMEGDTFAKVERICGPADSTYSLGDRIVYRSVGIGQERYGAAETVKVDMWVYHRSENELTRNLYFQNGVLVEIELGGRDG